MLGKTANGLFWMSRYMERAENIARLIETGQRMSLTQSTDAQEEWASVLRSAGTLDAFLAEHDEVSKDAAINWMLRDKANPSSIRSCVDSARMNARLVRAVITGEVWEAINATYMAFQTGLSRKVAERDLPAALRLIRQRTALVRGMVHGTMMRNDIYDFLRLGTFLERADNTARILDVKYYVLLPSVSAVGSPLDNVQWESILRSVSAKGGFRMEYGSQGDPGDIVHFLILDKRFPRSLAFCVGKLKDNLNYLNSGLRKPSMAQKKINDLQSCYLSHDVSAVLDYGLHEYIQSVVDSLTDVAAQIETDFRFYE